jgi:HEPN domain-containing protein
MSESEAQAVQLEEARRWLYKPREDLAEILLTATQDLTAQAAFHVQQALEKVLKALFIAASKTFRRIHELRELADAVHAHWPDLVPIPFPWANASEWYLATRYPELDVPLPPRGEIVAALAGRRLLDDALSRISALSGSGKESGGTDQPLT